ncbi:unnamed protein product [Parajaminaea phylloscopi]
MKLNVLFIALAAFVAVVAADIGLVKQDVTKIDQQAASLDNKLKTEDGSNYFSALAINGAAGDLDNVIKQATSDAQANKDPVTEADADTILSTLSGSTEPHVVSISNRLIAIRPNLAKIGVAGIAKGTLNNIAADTKAYSAQLVAQAPASRKDQAQALADKINNDLAAAVAAYASS